MSSDVCRVFFYAICYRTTRVRVMYLRFARFLTLHVQIMSAILFFICYNRTFIPLATLAEESARYAHEDRKESHISVEKEHHISVNP